MRRPHHGRRGQGVATSGYIRPRRRTSGDVIVWVRLVNVNVAGGISAHGVSVQLGGDGGGGGGRWPAAVAKGRMGLGGEGQV